jgi:pyruvate dehydrogenase E1 component beta subunit
MLYAMDSIVNQAAKWSYMTGGQAHPSLTIRAIINRGGEQGAQHSQSLHSWFSHIPGLRVVMPYSVQDARDMFIASVLCADPVVFIDDRWLYDNEAEIDPIRERKLSEFLPKIIKLGSDITIAASSYSTKLALDSANCLQNFDIDAEVIDIRSLNPFNPDKLVNSVLKTKRLFVIDGGWKNSGFSAELISSVVENIPTNTMVSNPMRITLANSPAPTASNLEQIYYPSTEKIVDLIRKSFKNKFP